jgi:glucuronokinase
MIIRTCAHPRAGLIGNPSDGYFGKTISFTFDAFKAEIELWESPELELVPSRRDHSVFGGLDALHDDVKRHGYYGGFRLLKATCKAFVDYCRERGIRPDARNFTLRYRSNIPNQVGLAGSSAIITACARALMGFYNVQISRHSLANMVLSVETQELLIPAGLQDRVAQAYMGLVYMDFDHRLMQERGYGDYQQLEWNGLQPALYIAYREDLSQGTEVYHNDLRNRYQKGDPEVLRAIARWAELTDAFRQELESDGPDRFDRLSALINENFDLRASLYNVGDGNRDLVATARRHGASAKFAGSGGAIVGLLADPDAFERLRAAFAQKGVKAIRPRIAAQCCA